MTALIGYGIAFGLGWLLNRQVQALLDLQKIWYVYLVARRRVDDLLPHDDRHDAALGRRRTSRARIACSTRLPTSSGSGAGCSRSSARAVRFLSTPHPVTRYLADASYWVYLMHLSTLIFFITLLRPYDWHWSIKLAISVGGSMPILLVTYHYFVRFTWIGAMLNGRRHPRPEKTPPAGSRRGERYDCALRRCRSSRTLN